MKAKDLVKIYGYGEELDAAYLINSGSAYIASFGMPITKLASETILAGTFEYFLKDAHPKESRRLFDLYLDPGVECERILFSDLPALLTQFKYGLYANIFLSHLIVLTNRHFIENKEELSRHLSLYELRAKTFTQVIEDLETIEKTFDHNLLSDVILNAKDKQIFRDAELYFQTYRLRAIPANATPVKEFVEHYSQNSVICREGQPGNKMYILLKGSVSVQLNNQVLSTIDTPGEAFCEMALFLEGERTATIIAESPTSVYVLDLKRMPEFVKIHPEFFINVGKALANRLYCNMQRISAFEERVRQSQERGYKGVLQGNILGKTELADLFSTIIEVNAELKNSLLKKVIQKYKMISYVT